MRKQTISVIEDVRRYYDVIYDEKELEERGFSSLEDFVNEEYNGNPWAAVGDVVERIEFNGDEDLIGSEMETISYEEEEEFKETPNSEEDVIYTVVSYGHDDTSGNWASAVNFKTYESARKYFKDEIKRLINEGMYVQIEKDSEVLLYGEDPNWVEMFFYKNKLYN